MARSLTNNTSLQVAEEESLGVLPGSPTWYTLEPNGLNSFGATISTVERSPISKNRQRKKGSVTDLDSAMEYEADMTFHNVELFLEGFMFSNYIGAPTFPTVSAVTDGGSGGYTVPSGGDSVLTNALLYAREFTNSGNNGLQVAASGSTSTNIRVDGLTAEASPPDKSMVEVCGHRGATGDLEIDASGDLISTVLDFTTLDIQVGQMIWIGGEDTANQFATTADRGFCRVTVIATNKLTLDKKSQAFSVDAGTGKEIDIYFGRFIRNVSVDDADFAEKSFHFEAAWDNLQNPTGTGDEYEYAIGNYCNTISFELPLTNKAGVTFAFIGTDTEVPTTSRKTGAATPLEPVKTSAMNTSADIMRLRIQELDETGLTTDFKSATLTINNNVSPEKVLANLGAKYMNYGNFEVDLETQILFTDSDVVTAIRNNTEVTMDFVVRNDDGAIAVDIPSITLGGGAKDLPVNESVLLTTSAMAFENGTLGYSIGVSLFPFAPSS